MSETPNEALIQKRKERGLFQEQVANATNISTRYYRKIEAGECNPNVETAISIADLLGCDVSNLFGPRRQPRENDTHPDYSKNAPDGEAEARELYDAADGLRIDAGLVLDVAKDGRLDDLKDREILARVRDAINAVLGEVA